MLSAVRSYLSSKRLNDTVAYVQARRVLTGNPLSPFYVGKKTLSLPTPTVSTISTEPVRNRSHALSRAKDLISQYALRVFDPALDAHKYFEWKFDLVDVCNIEDSFDVKLEVLTNCLPSLMRLELLQVATNSSSEVMFNSLLSRLDKTYGTIRATRHVESQFQQCRMLDGESISSFYSRFKRFARYHSKATKIQLSDEQLIVAFGAGLRNNKDLLFADIIEVGLGAHTLSFEEYAQRLLFLSARTPSPQTTDVTAIKPVDTAKRPRSDYNSSRNEHRSRGFGCYRCCEGNHSAATCPNKVKDFAKRCQRCGNRQHSIAQCKAVLTRDCKRCKGKHFESICPNDLPRTSVNANVIGTSDPIDHNQAAPATPSFDELFSSVSTCSVELISVDCCNVDDSIDNNAINLDVCFTSALSNSSSNVKGLMDTGSGANFLHPDLVLDLAKRKIIDKDHLHRTNITARFGNATNGQCDTVVKCNAVIDGVSLPTSFFVFPCSPQLIIGRKTLRELGLIPQPRAHVRTPPSPTIDVNRVHVEPTGHITATPWIEDIALDSGSRLMVRFPLLENVLMEPLREPLRAHSQTTEAIILQRLLQMEQEGSCVQCGLADIPVVVPVVLIDKFPGTLRQADAENLHSRYRITLDLRGYNRLELHFTDDTAFLISKRLASIGPKKKFPTTQFQRSSFEILRRIPLQDKYFSKIDISNAYNHIQLSSGLQHLGVEVYDAMAGHYRYFKMTTLAQGWKWSPLFFRMAITFILDKMRSHLHKGIHLDFYQDDVILTSPDPDNLRKATDLAVRFFAKYDLVPRPEKVSVCTTTITFCGYSLSEGHCVPSPKNPITPILKERLWEEFLAAPATRSTWIKSFSGMAQYLYGSLGPDQLQSLRYFYSSTSADDKDLATLRHHFDTICDYAILGVSPLSVGFAGNTIHTLVICDANQDSWVSVVLKILDDTTIPPPQEWTEIFAQLQIATGRIVPTRIVGGTFPERERRMSSTARERIALLLTVEECNPLLEGTVIVINDNRNCQLEWHNIEYLGKYLPLFTLFSEVVTKQLWLPRTSLPSIPDYLARLLGKPTIECKAATLNPGDSLLDTIVQSYVHDPTTYHDKKIHECLEIFHVDENQIRYFKSGRGYKLYIPDIKCDLLEHAQQGLRKSLLLAAHGESHLGVHQTRNQLKMFWWPNISQDVQRFVSSCIPCSLHRTPKLVDTSLGDTTSIANRPFQMWFIDHFEKTNSNGIKEFYLLAVDAFTRFVICEPAPSLDAETTASILVRLFTTFGIPTTIHSDRGSSFTSDCQFELCKLLKVDQRFSPVNFPRSNGLAERNVGTIKSMLIGQNTTRWACYVHNSLPHTRSPSKISPFEAAFGFKPRSLIDIHFDPVLCNQSFSYENQIQIREAFALEIAEYTQDRINQSALSRHADIRFRPGDWVIIHSTSTLGKHTASGPFILLNRIGSNLWRMFELDGLNIYVHEHPTARMKKYESSPLVEGLPVGPQIVAPEPAKLVRNDMVIVKKHLPDGTPSVNLLQVMSNDIQNQQVYSRLWLPNRNMEFFASSEMQIIPWDKILIAKFRLSQRMITDSIQKTIFTLLGEEAMM